jgi:hypothetical protein
LIASRYGPRIHAYEVLNEQNRLPPDGRGVPATVSARLHTKFYRFFKQEDARAPGQQWRAGVSVILGGLHPAGTGSPGKAGYVSDRDYLRQLYASDGFVSFFAANGRYPLDGLGYHPYPEEIRLSIQGDLETIGQRMNDVRAVLAEVDPLPPSFWVTEIGYNAAYGRQTAQGQADFLRAVYAGLGARSDVARIFWFKYEDFPPANGPLAQYWGVVRIPFTAGSCTGGACYDPTGIPAFARPSFLAYRELAGLPVYRVEMPLAAK